MRDLCTVPEGKYQVGIDGSNLEQLIAAWAAFDFDHGLYYDVVSNGDSHKNNAKAYSSVAGREITRGEGKNVTYAVLYGAGAAKISIMLGISVEKGQSVIDALWDSNPGLKARKEWLEKFWEATGKRFIPGLDGRLLWSRSKSSLLNLFFQNGGSSLMDLAGLLLHRELVNKGWYDDGVRRIIYYHKQHCGFVR